MADPKIDTNKPGLMSRARLFRVQGYHGNWRWGLYWGRWWMVQWNLDWTFSLGIHIDPNRRSGYGPYLDLHLVFLAISLGNDPGRANNHSLMRPRIRGQQ